MEKNQLAKNILASDNLIYFIFADMFIMLISAISHGSFVDTNQLLFALLAFFILLCPLINFRFLDKLQALISAKSLLLAITTFSLILFFIFDGGIYLASQEEVEKINALKLIAFAIFLFYFAKTSNKISFFNNFVKNIIKYKFAYLIILAIIMRIATIFFSPHPSIDVFYVTNGAVDNLVQGINPYSTSYFNPWPGGYSNPGYLPMIIFMNIPGRLLFGDIRFGYIIAQLLTAAVIYSLLQKKYRDDKIMIELPVLMFMFLPNSLFVLEQAWIEPLLLLILFLFALIFIKQKFSYLACIILGMFISLKQNHFPFLILVLANFRINFKKILIIILAIFLPVIPFLIWDYKSFIYTTVTYVLTYKVMPQSISINALYIMINKKELPFYISFGAILALLIFLILRMKKNSLIGYLHSSIIVMLFIFFMLGGYANYYYFISGSLVILITLCLAVNNDKIINNKLI